MTLDLLFFILGIYLLFGFAFALVFLSIGIQKVDEAAEGSGLGFKIIIFPGVMVFWPVLLRKWIRSKKNPDHD